MLSDERLQQNGTDDYCSFSSDSDLDKVLSQIGNQQPTNEEVQQKVIVVKTQPIGNASQNEIPRGTTFVHSI